MKENQGNARAKASGAACANGHVPSKSFANFFIGFPNLTFSPEKSFVKEDSGVGAPFPVGNNFWRSMTIPIRFDQFQESNHDQQ